MELNKEQNKKAKDEALQGRPVYATSRWLHQTTFVVTGYDVVKLPRSDAWHGVLTTEIVATDGSHRKFDNLFLSMLVRDEVDAVTGDILAKEGTFNLLTKDIFADETKYPTLEDILKALSKACEGKTLSVKRDRAFRKQDFGKETTRMTKLVEINID